MQCRSKVCVESNSYDSDMVYTWIVLIPINKIHNIFELSVVFNDRKFFIRSSSCTSIWSPSGSTIIGKVEEFSIIKNCR